MGRARETIAIVASKQTQAAYRIIKVPARLLFRFNDIHDCVDAHKRNTHRHTHTHAYVHVRHVRHTAYKMCEARSPHKYNAGHAQRNATQRSARTFITAHTQCSQRKAYNNITNCSSVCVCVCDIGQIWLSTITICAFGHGFNFWVSDDNDVDDDDNSDNDNDSEMRAVPRFVVRSCCSCRAFVIPWRCCCPGCRTHVTHACGLQCMVV